MKNILKSLTFIVVGGALGFIMLAAGALVTGARPWHGQRDPDVVAAAGPVQAAAMAGMRGEQMPEGMMMKGTSMGQGVERCTEQCMGQGMMGGMMAQHQETAKLVDQLVASIAAVEAEKDPAALKTKLSAHETLLKQLQSKLQESDCTMQKMHEQMATCPMMKGMANGQPTKQ